MKLTPAEIALLYFCKNNPGPNIKEMFEYADVYGIGDNEIRKSYLTLLVHHFVRPLYFSADMDDTYFPFYCFVTERGEDFLKRQGKDSEHEAINVPIEKFIPAILTKDSKDRGIHFWPKLEQMDKGEIVQLANVYQYWAKADEVNEYNEAPALYLAAARGYAVLGDELHLNDSLKRCFQKIQDMQQIWLFFEYADLILLYIPQISTVGKILEEFFGESYRLLTGEKLNTIGDSAAYRTNVRQALTYARSIGELHEWTNASKSIKIYGQLNLADDLLEQSFECHSESVFHSAIKCLYIYVNHVSDAVTYKGPEDNKLSYIFRSELAKKTCDILHEFSILVHLEEVDASEALTTIQQMVAIVTRLAVTPVVSVLAQKDEGSQSIQWGLALVEWYPAMAVDYLKGCLNALRKLLDQAKLVSNKSNAPWNHALQMLEEISLEFKSYKSDAPWNYTLQIMEELSSEFKSNLIVAGEKISLFKGQLSEHAVVQYFQSIGFDARKASAQLDHQKIDVIAEDARYRILIQVKYGAIAEREIKRVAENIRGFAQQDVDKQYIMAVVADSFPNNAELVRLRLEVEYSLKILFLHKYQIINSHPEHKRTLN